MDDALTLADPRLVRAAIAAEFLPACGIDNRLGEIRLAPHQLDAVSRLLALLDEHGGALLADETGMGKTYVALAIARAIGDALIVAPAALRDMWRESMRRAQVNASFVSYEGLSRSAEPPVARAALLIADEAHHARNPRTRRYDVLANLAWGARTSPIGAGFAPFTPCDARVTLDSDRGVTGGVVRSSAMLRGRRQRQATTELVLRNVSQKVA